MKKTARQKATQFRLSAAVEAEADALRRSFERRDDRLVAHHKAGWNKSELARMYQISRQRVQQILHRRGVK